MSRLGSEEEKHKMAATVQTWEMTAAASGVNKTSGTVRFKTADDTAADTNARLQIPASGGANEISYTKQLRFYFSTAPSVDIQNLRAYTDGGSFVDTAVLVNHALSGSFGANVDTLITGTGFFTKTSGSPADLDAINVGPHTGTGFKGDFLNLQCIVTSAASAGQLTAETVTFSYDET